MSKITVLDNYLKKEDYINLREVLESNKFPWFFYPLTSQKTEDIFNYQFNHVFYRDDMPNSVYFDILKPLIKQIKPISLFRVKANLNPISHKLVKFDKHVDQTYFKCKAAIYYVNDNNGYTVIEKKKIQSKSNRMVFFDTNVQHYGTNSTNCKNRMLINFNYF